MRKLFLLALITLICVGSGARADAGGVDARAAFDKLSSLEGIWKGTPEGEGEEAEAEAEAAGEVTHEIKLSANRTVVMETMNPGTEHEMINMYHVDGDDLVLTHYCAGGNQPRMRLDREASTADQLVFDFDGGTNLDPETDHYIRSAVITIHGDRVVSAWKSYGDGGPAGGMTFHLARSAYSE